MNPRFLSLLMLLALAGAGHAGGDPVAPGLREAARKAPVEVLLSLSTAPAAGREDLPLAFDTRVARRVDQLRTQATAAQARLRADLAARGIGFRGFWIANVVAARVTAEQLDWLASHPDVRAIDANPTLRTQLPAPETAAAKGAGTIEWGVQRVNAPAVWALGYTGQGVVVAGQDTGYEWDHPALQARYRGWDGVSADHDYNWHDAISELIGAGGNPCGVALATPCDDNNHGTHTMGTMVGDDGGANRIGVAPGASWIGCRNMEAGDGTPATYLSCFEWFMAPTRVDGSDPDPALAPHVINNSWGCPVSEGCTDVAVLQEAVDNLRAAGILVVASAGNSGSSCSSISTPAAIYDSSLTVGNTTSSDTIASSSSRGPVNVDGSNRLKPDIAAPGSNIRSSIRGGGYASFSGTSMAGPHVAGVAALLMSADPSLVGDPDRVEQILLQTAIPATSAQDCGDYPGSAVPNAVFGHGRIDALAAVLQVLPSRLFGDGFEAVAE